jgi:hypothetical protein
MKPLGERETGNVVTVKVKVNLKEKLKVKVKVKLFLCLTKHHAMKMYWWSGGIAARNLNIGTGWSRVVSFMPRPLNLRGNSPRTRWTGGWLGPSVDLDAVARRKISVFLPGIE